MESGKTDPAFREALPGGRRTNVDAFYYHVTWRWRSPSRGRGLWSDEQVR